MHRSGGYINIMATNCLPRPSVALFQFAMRNYSNVFDHLARSFIPSPHAGKMNGLLAYVKKVSQPLHILLLKIIAKRLSILLIYARTLSAKVTHAKRLRERIRTPGATFSVISITHRSFFGRFVILCAEAIYGFLLYR